MKTYPKSVLLLILFVTALGSSVSIASGEESLVGVMGKMQYFLHKTGLSLKAENSELTKFYIHELEEAIEKLESYPRYRDYPINELAEAILRPSFNALENSMDGNSFGQVWVKYQAVVDSCNRCHQATKHDFIQIEFNDTNTYLQSFSPAK